MKVGLLSLIATVCGVAVAVVPLFGGAGDSGPGARATQVIGDITVTGSGNVVAPQVGGGSKPGEIAELVTVSADENIYDCGTRLFVPSPEAEAIAEGRVEYTDWKDFRARFEAVPAGGNFVEASIQGESERTITLTRIEFDVERKAPPAGLTFANACGDGMSGRRLEVDLDSSPPRVTKSVRNEPDPEDYSQSADLPIRFPWTVAIDDPLLLRIVASSDRWMATWKARIYWRSGEKTGQLHIDNDGDGYTTTPIDGDRYMVSSGEGGLPPWNKLEIPDGDTG